jgi:hypothetical protein
MPLPLCTNRIAGGLGRRVIEKGNGASDRQDVIILSGLWDGCGAERKTERDLSYSTILRGDSARSLEPVMNFEKNRLSWGNEQKSIPQRCER